MMKLNRFSLPESARFALAKWLSVTLVALLSVPSAGFAATRRGGMTPRELGAGAGVATTAPVIEVNTTGDGDNVNPSTGCDADAAVPGEQCSLRAAIQRANALAGDDVIRFNIPATTPNCDAVSGRCTINLTRALPDLNTNVRIEGAGKVTVRRGSGGDYGIFRVSFASEATFAGLRIVNGKPSGTISGGAIANSGGATLNVTDSILVDNISNGSGGALSNDSTGTLNVTNSFIADNRATGGGGGILNRSGTLNVTGSVILNNNVSVTSPGVSGGGGGIINSSTGTVNVTRSIIGSNIITGGTGGSTARGGGILNASTGTVNVTNSVLFNNNVTGNGGGIANPSGSLNVTNSTITGNRGSGGGLFGPATVKSTIIAKNNDAPFAGSDVSGNFTSAGFNLVGVEDGSTGFNTPTDQKGTVAAPLDPKFAPNGVTISVPGISLAVPGLPLCGSPVIDKGTSAGLTGTLTTDLRGAGFPRTVDDPNRSNTADGTDAGAFERPICVQAVFTVNTTGDADDVNPGDTTCDSDAAAAGAQCTLRAAMREANAAAGDYDINFAIPPSDPGYDPAANRHTINLTGALPDITNSDLTINGPGADKLTVRRHTGGDYRIFSFGGVVETATLSGLTVSRGDTPGSGGGVSFSGRTLTVNNCVFTNNTAGESGGGISASAAVNVTGSIFSDNFADGAGSLGGGGIAVSGALSVTDSTFSDNLATGLGGGIYSQSSSGNVDSHITNSTFERNDAGGGGGISVGIFGAVMRVTNCTFRRNSSTFNFQGGGIYHSVGTLHVTGSTLSGNEGYGIVSSSGPTIITNITDSTISGNTSGGIFTEFVGAPTGRLNITNSTISGNTANRDGDGGAGISLHRVTLNVTNSTISHNEDGGIKARTSSNPGTWTVKSSIIAANAGFGVDVSGAFTSGGFNLIGKQDGSMGFTHPTDQTGTIAAPLDPLLDPLGNYGGPTQTHRLQANSPAIDKGHSFGLTTDGRGNSRPSDDPTIAPAAGGDNSDIGSFELQPSGPSPTPTPTPTPQPGVGLRYYPLPNPVRLLDTRNGQPACVTPGAPLAADSTRTQAARTACTGLPATAQAIVGNATVVNITQSAAAGFVTLYPSGAQRPTVSNLNYVAGQIVPNSFTVGLGNDGAFHIYSQTETHFIVDVTGYYAPPSTGGLYYHALPQPARLLDTRPGQPACDTPGTPLVGGASRSQLARTTCNGVVIPQEALAIVGNATVVNTVGGSTDGFITLYPSSAQQPTVSNLNYVAGQIVPNSFTVGLGTDGAFRVYASSATHFVVDIAGYYSPQQTDSNGTGLLYYPLAAPVRLLDTRSGEPACDTPGSPLTGGVSRTQVARTTCGGQTIPASAQAVVGNATAVNNVAGHSGAGGFVTLYPSGMGLPTVSNLNYAAGQVVPNSFVVGLGQADGAFNIYPSSTLNFIVDLSGYFAP